MLAQVIVGHDSTIYQVNLLTGHNNDAGALILTKMKEFLVQNDIKLLSDAGLTFF